MRLERLRNRTAATTDSLQSIRAIAEPTCGGERIGAPPPSGRIATERGGRNILRRSHGDAERWQTFDAWFDARTHLLSRIIEQQGAILVTETFSNYAPVDGALVAKKIVINRGDHKDDQTMAPVAIKFMTEQPAAAYAMPNTKVTDFSIAGGAREATFPFQLINNHIYANVLLNGRGPFLFIFDTGGVNLVTPSIAAQLGLKTEGKREGSGSGSGHVARFSFNADRTCVSLIA